VNNTTKTWTRGAALRKPTQIHRNWTLPSFAGPLLTGITPSEWLDLRLAIKSHFHRLIRSTSVQCFIEAKGARSLTNASATAYGYGSSSICASAVASQPFLVVVGRMQHWQTYDKYLPYRLTSFGCFKALPQVQSNQSCRCCCISCALPFKYGEMNTSDLFC